MIDFDWRIAMGIRTFFWFFLFAALVFPASLFGQTPTQPLQTVSVCDVLKDPKAFSGKNIRIHGEISSEFEDFTIYDRACGGRSWTPVWLMFGGDVDCPTPSTWNDVNRPKGQNVKFGGLEYSLIKDGGFQKFYAAITTRKNKKSVYQVTATLEGTFFAGDTEKPLGGYGHLGCCHLFIIHQISRVEAQKKPTA
jgi:hypothetical protein